MLQIECPCSHNSRFQVVFLLVTPTLICTLLLFFITDPHVIRSADCMAQIAELRVMQPGSPLYCFRPSSKLSAFHVIQYKDQNSIPSYAIYYLQNPKTSTSSLHLCREYKLHQFVLYFGEAVLACLGYLDS